MRTAGILILILGIIFLISGALFTLFTLGFGIICTWPLLLVGFLFLIIGAVLSVEREAIKQPQHQQPRDARYCPNCGRSIPMDANICPYCGKKFY